MKRHYHYLNTGWYVTLWIVAAAAVVWALLFVAFRVSGGVQSAPVQTAAADTSGSTYTAQTPPSEAEAMHTAELGATRHA